MADQTPPADDDAEAAAQQTAAEEAAAAQLPVPTEEEQPVVGAEQAAAEARVPAPAPEAAVGDAAPDLAAADAAVDPSAAADAMVADEELEEDEPAAPREKPAIPGMDLEVDIVLDGEEGRGEEDDAEDAGAEDEDLHAEPIAASIVLAEGARYRATGKRKTAVARVILKPGSGVYLVNGKALDAFFPRPTLQRGIRQPLEAVGYEDRMDVDVRIHGGGVSAQAGALRHGISRALLEADPNLRGELKKRGFLTRDPRVKERKKAGLKKARKKPQFSKR